ncbi:amidohydrolase [Kineococcus sp. SYSU DK005]|uniref:amidohydrolase n=1 Tax=Kineococcus sp. SYSU DK005 TaxID=3383126 RepID=UPI003D7E2820
MPDRPAPADPAPAVLLRRVRVHGAPAADRERDVLLAGGRVVAIGDDLRGELPGPVPGADAEVVEAGGAVLLPGLVDAHVHLTQWAAARRRVDVLAAGSAREAVDLLARGAAPGDDLVLGHGFRDALWPDEPHRDLLDARFGDRPVVVVSQDLHAAWVSSAAAARFGVAEPSGLLREAEAMALTAAAGDVGAPVLDRWVLEATAAAAARGVTGIVDLEYAPPAAWARRAALGEPAVRVAAGVWPDWLDDAVARGLRSGDQVPGAGPRVRVGPVKLVVDGSLGTRTAYCCDAYPPPAPAGPHGVLRLPPRELEPLLRRAAAHGFDVAVHAIGDAAVAVALDGFEAVGCTGRVEHAQQVREQDLGRFARLGVVASVQPRHAVDDRDLSEAHWASGLGRAFPYAALHAAGAELRLGSDAPVAPLDPWDAVASAVHRSVDERPAWHPEQHLPLEVALRAACDGRPAVRVGDAADVALVPEPPAAVLAAGGADALRRTGVLGTLVGGVWTHRAGV